MEIGQEGIDKDSRLTSVDCQSIEGQEQKLKKERKEEWWEGRKAGK